MGLYKKFFHVGYMDSTMIFLVGPQNSESQNSEMDKPELLRLG